MVACDSNDKSKDDHPNMKLEVYMSVSHVNRYPLFSLIYIVARDNNKNCIHLKPAKSASFKIQVVVKIGFKWVWGEY